MKNIILLGPPGCGKGTQAEILISKLGFIKISTGELLREVAKRKDEFGVKINSILSKGDLVSNEVVDQLVEDFYASNKDANGVILDGYPRNIIQANSLSNILIKYGQKIDKVFYFDLDEQILVKRIIGRYSCNTCKAIYNSFFQATKVAGICDFCGGFSFSRRSDDSEQVIIDRLTIFKHFISDLLLYYKNNLVKLDADKKVNVISEEMISHLI